MLISQNLSGKRNYKTSILPTMAGGYYLEYRLSMTSPDQTLKRKNVQTNIIKMWDQVWKDIFIFHTNMRKKNFFSNFFSVENAILFFHTFKTSVGTLSVIICDHITHFKSFLGQACEAVILFQSNLSSVIEVSRNAFITTVIQNHY